MIPLLTQSSINQQKKIRSKNRARLDRITAECCPACTRPQVPSLALGNGKKKKTDKQAKFKLNTQMSFVEFAEFYHMGTSRDLLATPGDICRFQLQASPNSFSVIQLPLPVTTIFLGNHSFALRTYRVVCIFQNFISNKGSRDLPIQPRLDSNYQFVCLSLPPVGLTVEYNITRLMPSLPLKSH